MKQNSKTSTSLFVVCLCLMHIYVHAQYCGIKDPGMERYSSCPTSHSQLFVKNYHWFNVLNPSVSTSDYYHEGHDCNFGSFVAAGGIEVNYCATCFPGICQGITYQGCGRSGIFLNYNDSTQDPKYKEYIGTRVDLVAGRTYTLLLDIQRSNDLSSNYLERDLAIYGYSGSMPAAHSAFCVTGAIALDTIPYTLFDDDSMHTLRAQFRCLSNFSYLILGAVCHPDNATGIGYVYIDNVILSDHSDSTLTPAIRFAGADSRSCCFSGMKNDFILMGNKAPSGTTVSWSQRSTNPELLSMLTPSDSSTRVSGSGYLINGSYQFYYTWSRFGCTITDTVDIDVFSRRRANAGPDLTFCNSNAILMNAIAPTSAEISRDHYLTWWSVIDTAQPGDVYTFPLSSPISQRCIPEPTPLSYDLSFAFDNTHSPTSTFSSLHQADTFDFIWNVVDECNTYTKDTLRVYTYQFMLEADTLVLCPGDTSGYFYESIDSIYNSRHVNRSSWIYNWSIVNDSGTGNLISNIHAASVRFTSFTAGEYIIELDIVDTSNARCSHYTASVIVQVLDTAKINHPPDIQFCEESNMLRIVQAYPNFGNLYWWDIIDTTQPDTLFTLFNPEFPFHFFDGDTNFNVRTPFRIDSTSPTGERFTIFYFPLIQAIDSFTLIYNIENNCFPHTIKRDTVTVQTHALNISMRGQDCPGDTVFYLFEGNYPVRHHSETDSSLYYYWHQISGPATAFFDSLGTADSIQVRTPYVAGTYVFALTIFDSDNLICPAITRTVSVTIIKNSLQDSVNAGPDIRVCNSQFTPYSLIMNARPSITTLMAEGYESWWSLVDYSMPDSEYVFYNGCEPGVGFDNGDVACGFDLTCRDITPYASDAPNCFFVIDKWGCYDFIWNVRYRCAGIEFYKKDTVQFCWDFLEPIADAGSYDTAACNVYALTGNLSAASAANMGCFRWRQISSTTGATVALIDTARNVSYMLGLDTLPSGIYTFEYTIGCGACSKRDTVSIFVPGSLPAPSVSLSSNAADIYICKGDSVRITATGADQYQFFVNGISVASISSRNSIQLGSWQPDTNIVSVVAYDNDDRCFSASDTFLLFIFRSLDSLKLEKDTITFCSTSSASLIGYTPYVSQRIFWFSALDTFTRPLNGPYGNASGVPYNVAPSSLTLYKAVLYDSLSSCWSDDTLQVWVNPVVAALPQPILPRDTTLCTYTDSVLYIPGVLNHQYAGSWTIQSTSAWNISNENDTAAIMVLHAGSYMLVWKESNLGCDASDTMLVNVWPYPEVNAGADTQVCKGKTTKMFATGNAISYEWTPASYFVQPSNLISNTNTIQNDVQFILIASNDICTTYDTIELKVLDCPSDINAPMAFSPNGDGNNDFFTVYTYQLQTYEISIFNRWGEQVYYSTDLNETNQLNRGWDGKYKGTLQEVGVYVYYITGTTYSGEKVSLQGNLTLIK